MVYIINKKIGHCKGFAPQFEKAAKALKGVFKVGAVEGDKEKELSKKYNIKGFPTVLFFGQNKNQPEEYNKGRTAKDVVSYMFDKARDIVDKNLGEPTKKTTKTNNNKNKVNTDNNVLVLTDKDFNEVVYKDENSMYAVVFYAPWYTIIYNI